MSGEEREGKGQEVEVEVKVEVGEALFIKGSSAFISSSLQGSEKTDVLLVL